MKKLLKILFSRIMFVAAFMLLQILAIVAALTYFNENVAQFYTVFILVSIISVVYILNTDSDPAYKIAWIIPILVLPLFGTPLYFIFGRNRLSPVQRGRVQSIQQKYRACIEGAASQGPLLGETDRDAQIQTDYLLRIAGAPVYRNTQTEFFPLGDLMYPKMLEEIRKAKKFIFLEYFIVEPGKMWNSMLKLLEKKAAEGVDVRLIYDDIGSILTLPRNYRARMEARGIKCCAFRRLNPVLSGSFNNRDHRKILAVDGAVAFTGGINLADEYINAFPKYGHWLDCGVMLRGAAAESFTAMFISMWDYIRREDEDFAPFRPSAEDIPKESDGFVQPFFDTPMDDEDVGKTAYMNIINRAEKYVYICTPYLVIDSGMQTALCTAAKSGVDVRIITPGVPDKRLVYAVTRSYYPSLIRAGVKIYEYSPGFMHSKTFVSDDTTAVCGTINLDYRSLYLHYECAAWMYGCSAVTVMRDDFLRLLPLCRVMDDEYLKKRGFLQRIAQSLLRVFAPLM